MLIFFSDLTWICVSVSTGVKRCMHYLLADNHLGYTQDRHLTDEP